VKRHAIDPLSFVFGVFFLIIGLLFAFGGDASTLHVAWFWPVVLGVTGVGLMLLTVRTVRPRPEAPSDEVDEVVPLDESPTED
jgi:hypothetical protein